MTASGLGTFELLGGTVNAAKYQQMLQYTLLIIEKLDVAKITLFNRMEQSVIYPKPPV